ncbi:MAG: M67 family metallopeptidase [Sulfolobales archaeon]
MITLLISKDIIDIFTDMVRSIKTEVAGFLLGTTSSDSVSVKEIVVGDNIDSSPHSFRLDPYAVLHTYRLAELLELEIVALIHSHPAPPYPSVRDRNGMKLWPILWVIVSAVDMECRAWILRGKGIEEVPIVLTE